MGGGDNIIDIKKKNVGGKGEVVTTFVTVEKRVPVFKLVITVRFVVQKVLLRKCVRNRAKNLDSKI